MKRFNIEKAKSGSELRTRSGRHAKILLFDRDSKNFPLVAIIDNKKVVCYTENGKFYVDKNSDYDLKMK